ncbi:MAG TPA: hypothetical protein PKN32_13380 [Bacteroidales bacterium]|nr:hypothetical protein [Bacteroidales bacterium]
MNTFFTILFGITMIIKCGQPGNSFEIEQTPVTVIQTDTTYQHLIYKGRLVELYVEKAIFYSTTENNFLMKFTVKNISSKNIGIDLTDYWKVVYPNQWGIYNKPYREVIDEEQIIPDTIINKTEILKKYKDNSLTIIKPDETIEYYRDWNGSGEKVELKNEDEFLIISVDGQLLFTDGEQLEHLMLNEAEETKRVVVLSYPINHKSISEESVIIKHK